MRQYRLPEPTKHPVYKVTDANTKDVLSRVYGKMIALEGELEGKEIWKGITISGGTYKLWGTEKSVDFSNSGVYRIGGIEAIVSNTLKAYQAIVNITVTVKEN